MKSSLNTFEYTAIGLFIVVLGYVFYKLFQSLYYRYFGSYDGHIEDYLNENRLQLIKVETPGKEDWVNSPFKPPKKIEISLVRIRVLGMPVDFSTKKYKLILAKSLDGKTNRIWMEIKSVLFSKPKFNFFIE